VRLASKDKALLESDLRQAVEYYFSQGIGIDEAFDRIGTDPFGDFYAEPAPDEWYPLDSAAKIYPLTLTRSKMTMFRISANMRDEVIPALLQLALDSAIKRFPIFATTLKRGLFWHYLDARRKRFTIEPETLMPCTPIKINSRHDQVFRLIYFRKRIALEVFHCVTDGGGAMVFMKALLAEYIRLTGTRIQPNDIPDIAEKPHPEEFSDAFLLTDRATETLGYGRGKALMISDNNGGQRPSRIIQLVIPAKDLAKAARKLGTTVSGLMLAAMFISSKAAYRGRKADGYFKIQLPVDMRQHYPSRTLRNFSMYGIIKIPYTFVESLDELIPLVNRELERETSKESLDSMVEMTKKLTGNRAIQFMPLGLKKIIISRIAALSAGKSFTGVLSNLGLVKTDFADRVERFDAISVPSVSGRVGCALVSYRDKAVLSITKRAGSCAFESKMYELLSDLGLTVLVEGNEV